jgi:hypothetical protein
MSATPDGMLVDPQEIIAALRGEFAEVQRTNADLQRQLAECKAERDEALARETATAEVLQVINSSPGDLTPVFDAMLEKATRVCEADFGVLLTLDGENLRTAALHNVPGEYAEFMRRDPPQPGPKTGGRTHPAGRAGCLHRGLDTRRGLSRRRSAPPRYSRPWRSPQLCCRGLI